MHSQLTHLALATLMGLAQCRSNDFLRAQEPLNGVRDSSMHVTLQDTVIIRHPADVANVNVRVKASGPNKAEAFRTARQRMHDVADSLTIFLPASVVVESDEEAAGWSDLGVGVDYSSRWTERFDEEDVSLERAEVKSPNKTVKAIGQLCARFHDVEKLRAFAAVVSKRHEDVFFGEIDWDLSRAAQKDAKNDARRKGLQQLVASGEEFVGAFGYRKATPVEFEEMYAYVRSSDEDRGRCGKTWYGMDEEDEEVGPLQKLLAEKWEVPAVQLHTEMKCKLRLQ